MKARPSSLLYIESEVSKQWPINLLLPPLQMLRWLWLYLRMTELHKETYQFQLLAQCIYGLFTARYQFFEILISQFLSDPTVARTLATSFRLTWRFAWRRRWRNATLPLASFAHCSSLPVKQCIEKRSSEKNQFTFMNCPYRYYVIP